MKEEKETAPGATNTESGNPKESEPSLSDITEKVKQSQAMGLQMTPGIDIAHPHPLDFRTEMFMLEALKKSMGRLNVYKDTKYDILSDMISQCAEASGI